MKKTSKQLQKTFLSRLRTQERAYNDLGVYYTPRLYAKLCKHDEELRDELRQIYTDLIDKIEIPINRDRVVSLRKVCDLDVQDKEVIVSLLNGEVVKLENFVLPQSGVNHITIDHKVAFKDLVEHNKGRLPKMSKLTKEISRGSYLSKEKMRKEYARIVSNYKREDIKELLKEVRFLAEKAELKLMPSHKNFSKGARADTQE